MDIYICIIRKTKIERSQIRFATHMYAGITQ